MPGGGSRGGCRPAGGRRAAQTSSPRLCPQDALMLGTSLVLAALVALGAALALLHWLLNADGMLWVQVRG